MTTNATHRSFITRLQYPLRLLLTLLSLLLWHLRSEEHTSELQSH